MEGVIGSVPTMDWTAKDLPAAWQEFREHATFVFDGPLCDKTEAQQCNFLMLWVGPKGREIYKTFTMTDDQKKLLEEYYTRFERHIKPRTNRLFARYKFQDRVQKEGETFEQFVTDLKLLAKDCGFQDANEMVRDRILFAVSSDKIREKLLNEGSGLTLEKAIEIGQAYELSRAHLKLMTQSVEIHAVKDGARSRGDRSVTKKESQKQSERKCYRCGEDWHAKHWQKCPAKGHECAKCHKVNHFESVCRSSQPIKRKDPSNSSKNVRKLAVMTNSS